MKITPQAADARALEEAAKAAFRKAQSVYRADHDHFPIVKTWESTAESVREGWRKIAYAAVESARENGPASPDYRALLEMAVEALTNVRLIIAEGAMTGFQPLEGDWANRLFHSQQKTSATLTAIKTALDGK